MNARIRPLAENDIEAVLQLSLLAWAPIFESFENVLGSAIYTRIYPDWRRQQWVAVEEVCRDEQFSVWVAESAGAVVGFIAYKLDLGDKVGEVDLLAVHPDYQNRGIADQLNRFVLEKMSASGMTLAVVGTGGDPGHAPARRSYEKAGYTGLPLVRYYKAL